MRIQALALSVAFFAFGCAAEATDTESSTAYATSHAIPIAPDLPEHCQGPEIVRIDRPVDKDDPARGSYSYAFRYEAPTQASAPVLVYLPGGPGSTSTQDKPAIVPDGWGYLSTDPRGVGCNTLASVPPDEIASEFFKTEELAADVIAAVVSRGLHDYVLYGVSYGTLLGTVVAHEIERQGLARPKAVVLEGVLGRAFSQEFIGAEYIRQWDRARGALPEDVLEELSTAAEPYGISPVAWSRALKTLLTVSPSVAAKTVASLSTGVPEDQREAARRRIVELGAPSADHQQPGAIELYRQIACREIADTVPANDLDVVFERGKLVRNTAEEGTKCRGLRLTTPYDSARLQFATKVYYFVGQSDVATPAWQGAYHFEKHQGHAVRVVTLGGGHSSLQIEQGRCAHYVMESIARGGEDFDAVMGACPAPVEVDTR